MGKSHQKTIFAALAALLLLAIVGLILTSGGSTPAVVANHRRTQADEAPLVDQGPLRTARSLASTAATPAERELAQEAARVADHEVDLAFASALREAAQHPGAVSPEARQLQARVKKLTAKVAAEQDWENKLGQLAAKAPDTEKARLEQQQQLVAAQLELDKDELGDAQNDLMRAGGNPAGKIERMREEHEDATHAPANTPLANSVAASSASAANAAAGSTASLIDEVQAWTSVRGALGQVRQAQEEASSAAAALSHGHEALEQETQQEQAQSSASAATPQAGSAAPAGLGAAGSAPAAGAADATGTASGPSLATLKHLAGDQKTLAEFDQRVQDEQELADVYGSWVAVLQARERAAAHSMLRSLTWILLVLLARSEER